MMSQSLKHLASRSYGALALAMLALLCACGGGSPSISPYQVAVDAANAKEAQVRALGVNTPCASNAQCGVLVLLPTATTCLCPSYQAYSLTAPTAGDANSTAAEQNVLALQARALLPGPIPAIACLCIRPPVAACTANTCALVP